MLSGESTNTNFIVFGLTRSVSNPRYTDKADWLAWNQDNVFDWDNMSICGLLFQ